MVFCIFVEIILFGFCYWSKGTITVEKTTKFNARSVHLATC